MILTINFSSAANSCPASPRSGSHSRHNVSADLQMAAAYAAVVAGPNPVVNTVTVSTSHDDRFVISPLIYAILVIKFHHPSDKFYFN